MYIIWFVQLELFSENFELIVARAVTAEKLNGKLVPGLVVYVENKSLNAVKAGIIATKPKSN